MNIAAADLLHLMKDAGLDPDYVDGLNPDLPLRGQGFKSVYCPALHLAIREAWDYEIPLEDCPGDMSLTQLAAYLSARIDGGGRG